MTFLVLKSNASSAPEFTINLFKFGLFFNLFGRTFVEKDSFIMLLSLSKELCGCYPDFGRRRALKDFFMESAVLPIY